VTSLIICKCTPVLIFLVCPLVLNQSEFALDRTSLLSMYICTLTSLHTALQLFSSVTLFHPIPLLAFLFLRRWFATLTDKPTPGSESVRKGHCGADAGLVRICPTHSTRRREHAQMRDSSGLPVLSPCGVLPAFPPDPRRWFIRPGRWYARWPETSEINDGLRRKR
jgi:hypothetical protein